MENGKAALAQNLPCEVGFGSTEFHVIRPSNDINARYLFHMVWNPHFRFVAMQNMTGSAGQKRVPAGFLERFEIPLPSLNEQSRIAAILDKADAIRRKRAKALELADAFLKSVFLEMFGDPVTNPKGWKKRNLEEAAEIQSGVTKGRNLRDKAVVSIPYMRVANVQDGRINLDDVKDIQVLPTDVKRYELQAGDVLLTEGGDPDKLGRGAVWRGQIEPCIHQNHIFRVRPNTNILLPDYLSKIVGSQYGKHYFLRAAKQTTGIATINKTQLREFPILLPDISIQKNFESFILKHDSLQTKLSNLKNQQVCLFNSLIQRAFRGEL